MICLALVASFEAAEQLDCMIKMNIYVNKAVNKRPYQFLSYM